MEAKSVVVTLSGGADSALAAVRAQQKYLKALFHYVFLDYGQEYAAQEWKASHDLAFKFAQRGVSCDWKRVVVNNLWMGPHNETGKPVEYTPLRNLVIVSCAAAIAETHGSSVIVVGSKSLIANPNDPYSFKDSAFPFYTLLEAAINNATENKITIDQILATDVLKMPKWDVYDELESNNINPTEVWSCYHPKGDGSECGECRNCEEKAEYLFE